MRLTKIMAVACTAIVGILALVFQGCAPNAVPPRATPISSLGEKTVIGVLDSATVEGDGKLYVRGWACIQESRESIAVDMYIDGPIAVGRYLATVQANLPSEPAIAEACDSTGTNYRFELIVSAADMVALKGRALYVYAAAGDAEIRIQLNNSPRTVPGQQSSNPSLSWSQTGAIAGKFCVNVVEAADPDFGLTNHLCSDQNLGLEWSMAGPIAGKYCIPIAEASEPAGHTWGDNYLCTPTDRGIRWSSAGQISGMRCVLAASPDPHTWTDNYFCIP